MELRGLFAEHGNKDCGVVVEGIHPNVVEGFSKVRVGPQRFLKPEYSVFNADLIVILQSDKPESAHMAEAVEFHLLEFIPKDPYNFLLREACKPESHSRDFGRTSPVISSSSAISIQAWVSR